MTYSNKSARQIDRDCLSALKLLRAQTRLLKPFDPVQQHIVRYAVVLSSGAIERSVKGIIVDLVGQGASVEVMNYLSATILDGGMNPHEDKISRLLKRFKVQWASNFNSLMKSVVPRCRSGLKSLVDNRNAVAHGKPISISFKDVLSYYCGARNVVAELEKALH